MTQEKRHLYNLNELSDYKISDGYPDVRGWDVKDIDNRVVGKVENLLVNKEAERVVYLDVEVDKSIIDANHDPYGPSRNEQIREFVNDKGENHLIIPIGLVELNSDTNYVYTNTIDHLTFASTKRYRKGDTIDRVYEAQVMDSYNRADDVPLDATRIRQIVREEIRKYHNDTNSYWDAITEEEVKMHNRYSEDVYDEDDFYERREFDDSRFKKRTPGL